MYVCGQLIGTIHILCAYNIDALLEELCLLFTPLGLFLLSVLLRVPLYIRFTLVLPPLSILHHLLQSFFLLLICQLPICKDMGNWKLYIINYSRVPECKWYYFFFIARKYLLFEGNKNWLILLSILKQSKNKLNLFTGDLLLPLWVLSPDFDLGDLVRCLGDRDLFSDLEYFSVFLSGDLDFFISSLFPWSGDLVFPLGGSLVFNFCVKI